LAVTRQRHAASGGRSVERKYEHSNLNRLNVVTAVTATF